MCVWGRCARRVYVCVGCVHAVSVCVVWWGWRAVFVCVCVVFIGWCVVCVLCVCVRL